MTCVRCGEKRMARTLHTLRRTIAGCAFVADVGVDACTRCRHLHVPASVLLAFDRGIAAELARHGPVSGVTFRFIRRAIPLQPIEVSRMLSVPLETITRWELGRRAIDRASWLVVATVALEDFERPAPLLPRIDALRDPVRSECIVGVEGPQPGRTLREVLALATGPVASTDTDIAETLDVSPAAVRGLFEQLAAAGLVRKAEVHASGAIRWEPCATRGTSLEEDACAIGMDLDATLPPQPPPPPSPPPREERPAPSSSRAAT